MSEIPAAGGTPTPTHFGPTGPISRGTQWFTPDGSGSIAAVTDNTGLQVAQNCYGVFRQVATNNPNSGDPLQYLGGMNDASAGLNYLGGGGAWSTSLGQNIGGFADIAPTATGRLGGLQNPLRGLSNCHLDAPDWAVKLVKGTTAAGAIAGALAGGLAGGGGGTLLEPGGGTIAGAAIGAVKGGVAGGALGAAAGTGLVGLINLVHGTAQSCAYFAASGSGSGGSGSGGGSPSHRPTSSEANLTPDRLKHILEDHDYSTAPEGASIWNLGTGEGDIRSYVTEAINGGSWTPDTDSPGDTWNVSADLGDYVGFEGDHTTPTSLVKLVIKDNGYIVTLYPQ